MPMQIKQLRSILNEYPMSMELDIVADKMLIQSTTIIELLLKLADVADYHVVSWGGYQDCIIRERIERDHLGNIHPRQRQWLEMDMR
jgi:hypothetical protein